MHMSKKAEKENNDLKENQRKSEDFSSAKSHESKKKEKVSESKSEKDQEVIQLKENVANLKKENAILKEKYLRSLADLDNQKKIHQKEISEVLKYGDKRLLQQLLFFPDNYERALQAGQQIEQSPSPKQHLEKELEQLKYQLQKETNPSKKVGLEEQKEKLEQQIQNLEIIQKKIKNLLNGLQMILLWFQDFLRKRAVEEIKVVSGKDIFDDKLHEALEVEENNDYPDGTILQVFQKGYKVHDRVLRPATVKISKIKEIENLKKE